MILLPRGTANIELRAADMKPTAKTMTPISPVRDRIRLARISIEKGLSLFSPSSGKASAPTMRMRTDTSIAEIVEKAIPLCAESKVLPYNRKLLLQLVTNKLCIDFNSRNFSLGKYPGYNY